MDKNLIRQASKNLELMDITVTQQSLTTDKSEYAFGHLQSASNTQQMRRRSEITVVDYELPDSVLTSVVIDVEFATRLISDSEDEESLAEDPNVIVEIMANFRVEYAVIKKLPPEDALLEFANYNAVHNAYPFWRELVFSMAKNAQCPPILVPLYHDAATGHVAGDIKRGGPQKREPANSRVRSKVSIQKGASKKKKAKSASKK